MLPIEERDAINRLVREQVIPAIGCTEPICVALAVSRATEELGCRPQRIMARLSANILKNAMGVGIPGTGMVGLPIAIALGAIVGKSAYGLEVLRDSTPDHVKEGQRYIDEQHISISLAENAPSKLYVDITVLTPMDAKPAPSLPTSTPISFSFRAAAKCSSTRRWTAARKIRRRKKKFCSSTCAKCLTMQPLRLSTNWNLSTKQSA